MGLAARAIARRRAEAALIVDLDQQKLQTLDGLLEVDPAIGQTRFHWLRSAPEAPGALNLVGLARDEAPADVAGVVSAAFFTGDLVAEGRDNQSVDQRLSGGQKQKLMRRLRIQVHRERN